uniref:Uncharacterized protein n=1 Tax=Paramormyrops kingsleyae TaxID=1676925 RepID=A0A3B3SU94_9TELE
MKLFYCHYTFSTMKRAFLSPPPRIFLPGGTRAAASSNRTLQPWLVGLSAVLGFLCVVFILLMVKRLCFEKDRCRLALTSYSSRRNSNSGVSLHSVDT